MHKHHTLGNVGKSEMRNALEHCMTVFAFASSIGTALGGAEGKFFRLWLKGGTCHLLLCLQRYIFPTTTFWLRRLIADMHVFSKLLILIFKCNFLITLLRIIAWRYVATLFCTNIIKYQQPISSLEAISKNCSPDIDAHKRHIVVMCLLLFCATAHFAANFQPKRIVI